MSRNHFVFILLSVLLFLLFCNDGSASDVKTVSERKKLIMLCHPDPHGLVKETAGGKYEGLEVSIMKTFANTLGVALEVRALPAFGDLIPALLAGKGDVIASSVTITKEREKILSFSESYFPVALMVVVRSDSDISSLSDLSGKTASVTKATIMEARVKQIAGSTVVYAQDSFAQYQAVDDGKVDYALLDSSSVIGEISKFSRLRVAFDFPEPYDYGFAFAPGSDLRKAMNEHLKHMRESGLLYTMIRRQLGEKALETLNYIKERRR